MEERNENITKSKKEQFKMEIPAELLEIRNKATDTEMLLSLNELIVHRILDGAKLSNHKHLKTWPGVIFENDKMIKLTVIFNSDEMSGDEAENYIYNKDFANDKVFIVKRQSVESFK